MYKFYFTNQNNWLDFSVSHTDLGRFQSKYFQTYFSLLEETCELISLNAGFCELSYDYTRINLIRFAGDVGGISSIPGSERSLEKEMATHSSILGSENSIDRGARHAIVHGVAKSHTQLSTHTNTHTHTMGL